MLNYIVAVNKNMKVIILDFEINSDNYNIDIGYETDCDDWLTDVEDYQEDKDIFFDINKAFKEPGIYRVLGYESCSNTPDGIFENYNVKEIIKIGNLDY